MSAAKESELIRVEHLKKVYKSKNIEYVAITDISLSVKKGEFITVLGPSGSGKTTLMNLIGALDKPTGGKIFIEGVDISTLDDNELAKIRNDKIGFIFQSYNLVPYLTALENVMLPLVVENKRDQQHMEMGKQMLTLVGLGAKFEKRPNELSGGEQQRVAIVRSLMNDPAIILADEPTGNLDSKTSQKVLSLLVALCKKKGITIMIVTHDPNIAKLSERSIFIKDGLIEKMTKVRP